MSTKLFGNTLLPSDVASDDRTLSDSSALRWPGYFPQDKGAHPFPFFQRPHQDEAETEALQSDVESNDRTPSDSSASCWLRYFSQGNAKTRAHPLSSFFQRPPQNEAETEANPLPFYLRPSQDEAETGTSLFGPFKPSSEWKCYVGMTMDLDRREKEHTSDYGKIRKWKWHGTYFSKTEAQAAEKKLARELGCHAHAGGPGNEHDIWHVYSFEYQKNKHGIFAL